MQLVPLLAAGGVAGISLLVLRLLHGSFDNMVSAFASLVGGYRGEGWPVGVQEEDRDRPWGHAPETRAEAAQPEEVAVSPLRPRVRRRQGQ